jgi:hypothetical protein
MHGQHLTTGSDVAGAPAYADLPAVQLAPDGTVWTVASAGKSEKELLVRAGYSAAQQVLHTGFDVGYAQLAFGAHPVLTGETYAAVTKPVHYATQSSSGKWSGFSAVAHTWTVATNAVLKSTRRGLRVVAATADSSYRPVIASWDGTGFGKPRLTADSNSCAPTTHDGSTDPSGRLLDVSWECGKVTVADYVDDRRAAIVRFTDPNTSTLAPQIASGTRGIATVAYSDETNSAPINHLRVVRVRVPDTTHKVTHRVDAGRVTVTAPTSCLPAVQVGVAVAGRPARGWRVQSRSLHLDGATVGAHLDGASLASGKHTLTGTVSFAKGKTRATGSVSVPFTSC